MKILGSARLQRAGEGILPSRTFPGGWKFQPSSERLEESSFRRNAETSTRHACAPRILAITFCLILNAGAATLQERIDATAPNETIRVEAAVHAGPIIINKPLTLHRRTRRRNSRQWLGQRS